MKKVRKYGGLAVMLAVLAAVATACGPHDKVLPSVSDSYLCVYDGVPEHGERLKLQVPPASDSKTIDDRDIVIQLPTSNRFFMAAEDDQLRDPLAPRFYEAAAQGQVPVHIQGQVRFRFNLAKACEWFNKHGKRNVPQGKSHGPLGFDTYDLGFNKRGQEAFNAGWFHFLAENFGLTMRDVASERTGAYDWAALHYNFPVNANDSGIVPEGQDPGESTRLVFGRDLGTVFTERLNQNLGGDYFCGIDPGVNGATTDCPPMTFQVLDVTPSDQSLLDDREALEREKQRLKNIEIEGEIEKAQLQNQIEAERVKQQLLAEQAKTAKAQAEVDRADCLLLVEHGLDCDGHFQPVIVAGNGNSTGR